MTTSANGLVQSVSIRARSSALVREDLRRVLASRELGDVDLAGEGTEQVVSADSGARPAGSGSKATRAPLPPRSAAWASAATWRAVRAVPHGATPAMPWLV